MARIKRGALVASMLMVIAVVTSACFKPYSEAPTVTDTPIGAGSLFNTSLPQPTNMTDVQNFATGTALAIQNGGTPGTEMATASPMVNTTPLVGESLTASPTAIIALPTNAVTTPTATLAVASTNQGSGQVVNTSVPVGSRPATYTLQEGEFVYCLARRFDVDPAQILSLNGLAEGTTIYAGTVLRIPQSGSFPGARALRNHPTTYTASAGETLYGVACEFGDVYPDSIATANGLSVGTTLTAGQQLSIP